jgi:signal transduction histidine kinase
LRALLPRGDTLPDSVWEKRHRFLTAVLVAHAFILPVFGVAMGFSVGHSVLEGGLVPAAYAAAGLVVREPRKLREALVTVGLLSCSALLTHLSGGYIEAHFHFFIVVVMIGLYEDWLPFGLALGYVVLHHGVVGSIDPSAIYNHPAGQAHPWRWAAIHGAAISLAGAFSIWAWKLNEDIRAQKLKASRAEAAAAAEDARRRIERDLHDGIQQQLVALAIGLRAAEVAVPPELEDHREELAEIEGALTGVLSELRDISRGVHPAVLEGGGLEPALRLLARRSAVPVQLDVHSARRPPERVEVAAYYLVSEALTNTAKHAHASLAHVELDAEDANVHLAIRDDGVGGADPAGSGLVGLRDRVEALGGRMVIVSPLGHGTSLDVWIPTG